MENSFVTYFSTSGWIVKVVNTKEYHIIKVYLLFTNEGQLFLTACLLIQKSITLWK